MTSLKELPNNLQDFLSYLSFKSECIFHQERQKIKVDIDAAKELEHKLSTLIETKTKTLIDVMPKITKMKPVNRPKQWTKNDGSLTAKAIEFEQKRREAGMPEGILSFNVVSEVINGNPSSTPQVKDWLFSLGWEPCTFKYPKAYETDKDGNPKQPVPQVRYSSAGHPKKGQLTKSVIELAETHAGVSALDELTMLKHRLGIVQKFISPKFQKDGYIKAVAFGLTNTMRFTHEDPVVNLPKVDTPYGKEIRGLLICEDDEVLVGSDLVSLEDTTKRHYIRPFDPEYVAEMEKEGFDPHLDLARFRGVISQDDIDRYNDGKAPELKPVRTQYKGTNYSATYGIQANSLARDLRCSVKEAQGFLNTFWERNKAILTVSNKVRTKTLKDGSMWLYNPVSKFWYSLRKERDKFSTTNQSTGVFVFDTWLNFCSQKGQWPVLQMHDEQLARTTKDNSLGVREIMLWAIQKTNEKLGLNVEIKIDIQEGKSYAECH